MLKYVITYSLLAFCFLPIQLRAQLNFEQAFDAVKQVSFEATVQWEKELDGEIREENLDILAAYYLHEVHDRIAQQVSDSIIFKAYLPFCQLTYKQACGLFVRESDSLLAYFSDDQVSYLCLVLKQCCIKMGDVYNALRYAKKEAQLALKKGKLPAWIDENDFIQAVYYDLQMYPQALGEAKKNYLKYISFEGNSASHENNFALFFEQAGELDSALFHYQTALRFWQKEVEVTDTITAYDHFFRGLIQGNMASCFYQKGDYEEAIRLFQLDIEGMRLMGKDAESGSRLNSFFTLAQAYLKIGDVAKAQLAWDSAKYFNQVYKGSKYEQKFMRWEAELAYHQGDYDRSFQLNQIYQRIQDSIYQHNKLERVENLAVLYGNDLQGEKIATQQLELVKSRQRQALIGGLLLMFLLISAALIWGFRLQAARRREVEAKNREIASQKQEIQIQLNEKVVLIREVHHRVKNNLQLVSGLLELQIGHFQDDEVQAGIKAVKQRVKSMAILHEKLYASPNLAEIPFSSYVEELVENLRIVHVEQYPNIHLEARIVEAFFNIDQLIPLGLIINELVTNAYKHAFPVAKQHGHIHIDLIPHQGDKFYNLTIKDDGIGALENQRKKSNSLGMTLVAGLARQIKGNLNSKSENGSAFTIIFEKIGGS